MKPESLTDCRRKIDELDGELVRLMLERLDAAAEIARIKQENGLPIHDPAREAEKLDAVARLAGEERAPYLKTLCEAVFAVTKAYEADAQK